MQYEMRHPTTESEAIDIISSAVRVIYGQIEVYRGAQKKAWNGEYVDHVQKEATHALAWLSDRNPQRLNEERESDAVD